jgi:hypothetical protein
MMNAAAATTTALDSNSINASLTSLHQEASTGSNNATAAAIEPSPTMNAVAIMDVDMEAVSSPFQNLDVLKCIVSFIGKNQYRFVAAINQSFKMTYHQLYPNNKTTYYNASTLKHAMICFEECHFMQQERFAVLCTDAARHGNLSALQYLRENEVPWDQHTSSTAAKFGHLHILQYLHTNHCPWDAQTCANAALYGHLEVLQYARRNDCPCDGWTCRNAAENGNLEVLQWAHENGCPWNSCTSSCAAFNGHLTMLQWAVANGCICDIMVCAYAAANGDFDMLIKMVVHGMNKRVQMLRRMVTYTYCNGHMQMIVHGRKVHVKMLRLVAI